MKKIIKEILMYLLTKVDELEAGKIHINHEVVIGWKKIIPLDDKWYHFATTVEMWVKRKKDGSGELYDSICVYKDGKDVKQIKKLKDLPLDAKMKGNKMEAGLNFENIKE